MTGGYSQASWNFGHRESQTGVNLSFVNADTKYVTSLRSSSCSLLLVFLPHKS